MVNLALIFPLPRHETKSINNNIYDYNVISFDGLPLVHHLLNIIFFCEFNMLVMLSIIYLMNYIEVTLISGYYHDYEIY